MNITVRHELRDRFRIAIRDHDLVVDQPAPHSDDAGPTPTELFVASLTACAGFYARRFLARHGLADGELAVDCSWEWAPDKTRVGAVAITVTVPMALSPELEAGLRRAIDHCTVHESLRTAPVVTYEIAAAGELASV